MTLTDTTELTDAIRQTFERNAIVEYIIDEHITQDRYDTVDSLITDLEMAHCAAGSFSGMIYTRDILDRLSDEQWRDAIESAIESYTDATGESPQFDRDCMGYQSTFSLANIVTFAVDWMSNEIANALRSNGTFYIVTQAVDSMDPSPERKVFLNEWEAQDFISESLMHRMDHIVQHSPYAISEEEREQLEEQEMSLITMTEESV
jgi:hypothetical protein